VTWGNSGKGGDSSAVAAQLQEGVIKIQASEDAFSALKCDGSVITWGSAAAGGDSSSVTDQLQSDVQDIFSSGFAFAALKKDGSVVTWGDSNSGGDPSLALSNLQSGVSRIFSTHKSFAALKNNGSVVTWGLNTSGGDSSLVASNLQEGIMSVFSTHSGFAALKDNGSVIAWGGQGGSVGGKSIQLNSGVASISSPFSPTSNLLFSSNLKSRAMVSGADNALLLVNTKRSFLGSISNRLFALISNLTSLSINLYGSLGQLLDADYAAESSSLAKSQILMQASMAMLAQANASKDGVMILINE
jgi:flagellin-like hook-associated protein FlgL